MQLAVGALDVSRPCALAPSEGALGTHVDALLAHRCHARTPSWFGSLASGVASRGLLDEIDRQAHPGFRGDRFPIRWPPTRQGRALGGVEGGCTR